MTKPSPHQLHMLHLFSKGWRFKLYGNTAGAWRTYWALRNKGLCRSVQAKDVLTDKGREALDRWGHEVAR